MKYNDHKMGPMKHYFYLRTECNYKPLTAGLVTIQTYASAEEYQARGQAIMDWINGRLAKGVKK